ncbi:MAG: universal stress protein [Nitrospira sp.]|nr:universal stress protein UspA [Candidatus Manganitrophaceae bacterium]HIL35325.1 universal stress protein UspA [Candidatus Manganitrophaceae bacterium]
MYKSIYIPVDNSDYANTAIDIGIMLAKQFGSKVVGSHAYAAKLHDKRFKQMEAGLPEEYHDENELERQRKIHDSLITRGLEIITDSYLDIIDKKASESNVPMERRSLEGKNYKVLVEDIVKNGYDLVILGALGVGAVKESMIGSVTERTIRRVRKSDIFVVKETEPPVLGKMGKIVVAVDGSHHSFGGFKTALGLAKAYDLEMVVVSAFDPYYHYAVFNSIAGVLNEEAGKVFRFKEQEKLHEDVIDSGLAKIYQSHLEVCLTVAETEGVKIKTALLDGKPFEKVIQYVRKERPWLLVVGRVGVHSDEEMDVGSNAENLIRMAPCNVLVSNKTFIPPIDAIAEYTVAWTEEAAKRMEKVPIFARGVAKTAVYRYAIEKGFTIISNSVVDAAMGDILPKSSIDAMKRLGKELDEKGIDRNKMTASDSVAQTLGTGSGMAGMMVDIVQDRDAERAASYDKKAKLDFHICGGCGYTAKGEKPVKCPICNADGEIFQFLDKSLFTAAAKAEGELSKEVGYDGVPLSWTEDAKNILRKVPAGFERRRAKAKVEKTARKMGLQTLTKEFVVRIIEAGEGDEDVEMSSKTIVASQAKAVAEEKEESVKAAPVPKFSYSPEAQERVDRVPVGFMRDATRQHIENHAFSNSIDHITLEVAEAGIKKATEEMEAVMSGAASLDDIRERLASMATGATTPPEETFHFCGLCGHVVAQVPEQCPVCEAKKLRFVLMEEAIDYFICLICSQVVNQKIPDHCALCGGGGEYYKKMERKESGIEKAFASITWTDEAKARMNEIPEGFMREMTSWRIEADARKKGIRKIDPAVINAKYEHWSRASRKVERHLPWDDDAERRMALIPSFVRGTVVSEIESYADEKGFKRVSAEILNQVTERWAEAMRSQGF